MSDPLKLDPDALYTDRTLGQMGFSTAVLARARKAGALKHRRVGRRGRPVYFGSWLTEWLAADPDRGPPPGVAV